MKFDKFISEKQERRWGETSYGFKISKFLLQYADKNLKGEQKIQIIFNDFFGTNTYSYAANLLLGAQIEGYIKSYKFTNYDRHVGKYMNVLDVTVYVIDWYKFLRKLDDGHLENFKLL